jgi:7-carboxy-7-deazaguanine synthase
MLSTTMRIAEIFYSIQGEGRLTGVPSAFIRTSGCNLRCAWCDSDYTSWNPEGESLTVDAILDRVATFPTLHVVLTGGEPLIAPEIEELCAALRERKYHITVETAATVFKPLACDLASLSPKLSNSVPNAREGGRYALKHEQLRLRADVIQAFMEQSDYQLKFVVDCADDLNEIQDILEPLHGVDAAKVLLMPLGVTPGELHERGHWIIEECKRHGYRFCPRLQIEWFGNVRGT